MIVKCKLGFTFINYYFNFSIAASSFARPQIPTNPPFLCSDAQISKGAFLPQLFTLINIEQTSTPWLTNV